MSINFIGESKKRIAKVSKSSTALDRPASKGFARVFKSAPPQSADRAMQCFATNSAIGTRLKGLKLW